MKPAITRRRGLNEGAGLEFRNIIGDRKLLHVRKCKQYKERYVPIAAKNYKELRLYMDYGRPQKVENEEFIDALLGHTFAEQYSAP